MVQKIFAALDRILRGMIITASILAAAVISSIGVAVAFVASCALLTCGCLALAVETWPEPKNTHENDDTQNYLVDFAPLLGPDWEAGSIRSEKNGDIFSTDIFDHTRFVIGRSSYGTASKTNGLAYFNQYVFKFTNESEANKQFDRGREWIFVYFEDIGLRSDVMFQADEYQVACENRPLLTRCNGLFRYRNYIVFTDAILVRDSIRYLSEDDFIGVLKLIDGRMEAVGEATPTPEEQK